jgi:signal transduction histidine kinase
MEDRLQESLQAIATVAADQFDAVEIERIRGRASLSSPTFRDVVERLERIRESVPRIKFAYIMRRTDDPMILEFVADADSLATPQKLDENANGVVEPDEAGSLPGDPYDVREIPALWRNAAFDHPSVDADVTIDQWGMLVSGYAPIRDEQGRSVAVLGIDMDAADYATLSTSVFSPIVFLLFLIAAVCSGVGLTMYLWLKRTDAERRIDRERSGLLLMSLHQIGTPLTIFKWSLDELHDQMEHGVRPDDFRETLQNMEAGTAQLDSILTELTAASQIEGGSFPYAPKATAIRPIVDRVIAGLAAELNRRDQHVHLLVTTELKAAADPEGLTTILRELLSNASTFSPSGSEITVAARLRPHVLEIDVVDRGCGICPHDLPFIFDKFFRGSQAHLHQPNGNGLGLFIAKGIVERAGGHIEIDSIEDEGTTARIRLPQ